MNIRNLLAGLFIALLTFTVVPNTVVAHSGRTDSSGGHNCSATSQAKGLCSGYHYHNGGTTTNPPVQEIVPAPVVTPPPVITTPKPVVQPAIPEPTVKPTVIPTPTPVSTPKPTPKPKTAVILNKLVSTNQSLTLADLILQELKAKPGKTVTNNVLGISNAKSGFYPVTHVIDGDTIQVVIDNKKETLRLIGIDTPETVDPRKPVQCFGKEASAKAKSLLSGKSVRLEADPTQGERDKYQRLLRYVFLENGTNFNKLMIAEGYAHEYTYNTPYKYQVEFKQAQKEAEANKRGLWADDACSTSSTSPTQPPRQESGTSGTSGNFACSGKTLCGQMTSCAEANFYLNTCGVSRLDGDKDGVPCESLCN